MENEENKTTGSEYSGTANDIKWSPIPEDKPEKKKKHGKGKIIAIVVAVALLAGLAGFGTARLSDKISDAVGSISKDEEEQTEPSRAMPEAVETEKNLQETPEVKDSETEEIPSKPAETENVPSTIAPAPSAASGELSAADIYEACVNSTVGITGNVTVNYWGYQSTSAVSGSGFIVSEDGYIVTNYHVIEDVNDITVTTYSGESYSAQVAGYDESNDFAVLKVDAKGLSPVTLGDSDSLRVGDQVLAIGNPLGELTFSLTSGIVSALDREISLSNNYTMALIQTDCAINSGNSGGALFNMSGEVIGITNAKYSSSSSGASIDNIGFAIPINDVENMIESIMEKGSITKPYIGITVSSLTDGYNSYGASVVSVVEGSPAEKAGLQVGDVITAIDGETVTTSDELVSAVKSKSVGDKTVLTVLRNSKTTEIKVTVGEQTQTMESIAQQQEETEAEENTQENNQEQSQQNPYGYYYYYGNGGNGSNGNSGYNGSEGSGNNGQSGGYSDFFNGFNW